MKFLALLLSFHALAEIPDFLYHPLDFHEVYWEDTNYHVKNLYKVMDTYKIDNDCSLSVHKHGRVTICITDKGDEKSREINFRWKGMKTISYKIEVKGENLKPWNLDKLREFDFPSLRKLNFETYKIHIFELGFSFEYRKNQRWFLGESLF